MHVFVTLFMYFYACRKLVLCCTPNMSVPTKALMFYVWRTRGCPEFENVRAPAAIYVLHDCTREDMIVLVLY